MVIEEVKSTDTLYQFYTKYNKNMQSMLSLITNGIKLNTEKFTISENKKITLSSNYIRGRGHVIVFIEGELKILGESYIESSSNSITLIEDFYIGLEVVVIYLEDCGLIM